MKRILKQSCLTLAVFISLENENTVHATEAGVQTVANMNLNSANEFVNFEQNLEQSLSAENSSITDRHVQQTLECKEAGSWGAVLAAIVLILWPRRAY